MEEVVFSFDVEGDGPSPYGNSMRSFGGAVIGMDKKIIKTWEWNFFPLEGHVEDAKTMNEFWSKNTEAWEYINKNKQDPLMVFKEWATELTDLKKKYKLVPVAWPAAYDWQWLNYYFAAAKVENPLGFSAFCISTFIKSINPNKSLKWDGEFDASFNDPNYPHTHKPLDDALEQGMKYLNAVKWYREQV